MRIMSNINGTSKSGFCELASTQKFRRLNHFNDEHLLHKKSEFIKNCRHEKKLLVKSAEKQYFFLYLYCCIILVFTAIHSVLGFYETKKKIPKDIKIRVVS